MKRFHDWSLRNKVTASTVAVTGLALSVALILAWREAANYYTSDLHLRAEVNTRLVGDYTVSPLVFDDPTGARGLLEKLLEASPAVEAAVFDTQGNLFAAMVGTGHEPRLVDAASKNEMSLHQDWLVHKAPINYKGEHYGTIQTRWSLKPVRARLARLGVLMLWVWLILVTLVYFIASRLQSVVFGHVLRLAEMMRKFSQEDDYKGITTRAGGDEVGDLYDAFNVLLNRIKMRETERDRARERLIRQKEFAEITLQSIGDAVITTDSEEQIVYLNPLAETLTGVNRQEGFRGLSISEIFSLVLEGTRASVPNPVSECLRSGQSVKRVNPTVLLSSDGREYPIDYNVSPIVLDNVLIGTVLVFRDVSESRELTRQLSHQATHDALTGLVNRQEFENILERALQDTRTKSIEHCVLYMDLDQFKVVNDTCGHRAGDKMLEQLSALLSDRVRESDTLARLGGDEFGVLLYGCHLNQARSIANQLHRTIHDFRFSCDNQIFRVGASTGLVMMNANSTDVKSVLTAADVACYSAKDAGRNRTHVYQADDAELSARQGEMKWITRITDAIEKDRFELYCQPMVALSDNMPMPVRYEILLRLRGQDGSLVPPMSFLPAAERYGIINSIDGYVIRKLFRHLSLQPALLNQCFSINISGQSLGEADFLRLVVDLLDEMQLKPGTLCFEVTETAAIANLRDAIRFMEALKSRGCLFALDDFGSGLSSFNYLKTLPVDYLKIDGFFVKDIMHDPVDATMVESIIRIGQVVGLKTIAEFVENDKIMRHLQQLGADYAQGYAIAQPFPIEDIIPVPDSIVRTRIWRHPSARVGLSP